MTKRERIIAALHFKETDRLPFAPLCDNYFASSLVKQGHEYDLLKAMRYIGCDIIERHSPCYSEVHSGNIKVEVKEEQRKGQTVYNTYIITPVGTVNDRRYFEDGTMYMLEHFIKDIEDIKTYTYIAEHTNYKLEPDWFNERKTIIGDDGIPTASAPCSPLLETIQVLAGLENSTYMLMDDEDVMESFFAAMHERNKRVYKLLTELDTEAVFCYEDTSTTMLNRDWMEKYAIPALNDYAKILKKGKGLFITHMCGKLTGFKDLVNAVGSDGIDSVCPLPTGDLNIWDARAAWSGKLLIGGIDPPSLKRMSEEECVECVKNIYERMKGQKGFILSTGDAVPHGTPIGNMKAIQDFIKGVKKLD